MNINRRLNIVIEVTLDDGKVCHVYSTPISREVYKANYRLLAKALTSAYDDGLGFAMVSRVALMALRDTARASDDALPEKNRTHVASLEKNFLPEIWRLTNVSMPTETGNEELPFQTVIDKGIFNEEDLDAVQNVLCFFTAASWLHTKEERAEIYLILERSGYAATSLSFTEYLASLKTSKKDDDTGAKAKA